jgi:hypothetical protein
MIGGIRSGSGRRRSGILLRRKWMERKLGRAAGSRVASPEYLVVSSAQGHVRTEVKDKGHRERCPLVFVLGCLLLTSAVQRLRS